MKQRLSNVYRQLQRLGPAMMPVIAIMPIAGLLYGLGVILTEPTIVGMLPFLQHGFFTTFAEILFNIGSLITTNLHILFAISIAASFCNNDAIAGLSGGVAFLALCQTMGVVCGVTDEMVANDWSVYANVLGINTLSMGVFGGILSGCMVAWLFNRYKNIKLPQIISFFQGKRFIPIISIFAAVILGVVLSFIWPTIQTGISAFGNFLVGFDNPNAIWITLPLILFTIRMLLVFGLHTLVFVPLSFQFGTWVNSAGEVFHGVTPIFMAQMADGAELTTFGFVSGNYAMMFSYLALGCAFIYTARKEKKAKTKSQIIPTMITVGLTGISEPLEYSYLFNCFPAYLLHSAVMAISSLFVIIFHMTVGTGSWGGLLDFLIYGILQNNPTWLHIIPVGICCFFVEFIIMTFAIKKFNWSTPGREKDVEENADVEKVVYTEDELPYDILKALGGKSNIKDIDACATRLRVTSEDVSKVDQKMLTYLGASGIVKVGNSLQIIFGAKAVLLKDQISCILEGKDVSAVQFSEYVDNNLEESIAAPCDGKIESLSKVQDQVFSDGMMGIGFAVVPESDLITSPINGKILSIFPTKHAISILSDNGKEVLVHMGIDTVKMNGEPFEILVKDEDIVSIGTPLARMNLELIKEKGFDPTVCVVFTNVKGKKVQFNEESKIIAGQEGLITLSVQ